MKTLTSLLLFGFLLCGCGEEGRQVERDVDRVMEKVEDKAEVLAD